MNTVNFLTLKFIFFFSTRQRRVCQIYANDFFIALNKTKKENDKVVTAAEF